MQNEPNLPDDQMNVTSLITMNYEQRTMNNGLKNKANSNPIKPNFKKTKMNVTSILTVGYENKPPIRAPKKQSQISKRQKTMQPSLPQRIMRNTAISVSEKTNPIKPNPPLGNMNFPTPKTIVVNMEFLLNNNRFSAKNAVSITSNQGEQSDPGVNKSLSFAWQLVREHTDSSIKSLPKIAENTLSVKKRHTRRKTKSKFD